MTIKDILTVILLGWNGLVFSAYAWDKFCARRGYWRLPEKFLVIISIFLGGLGAILAGHFLRHKIRKWYFKLIWWLSLALLLFTFYMIWFGGL